jgi:hypothetical protein
MYLDRRLCLFHSKVRAVFPPAVATANIVRSQETFNFHVLRQIRLASPQEDPNAPLKPLDPAAHKMGYGCNASGKGKKALSTYSMALGILC